MKKALGETQTLRAGCSKAEPKNSPPAADPLPGGTGRPKFNQLETVTTFTYKPSLVRIDARNFELSWQRDSPSHKHRQDWLQYTAPQLSAQCNQQITVTTPLLLPVRGLDNFFAVPFLMLSMPHEVMTGTLFRSAAWEFIILSDPRLAKTEQLCYCAVSRVNTDTI